MCVVVACGNGQWSSVFPQPKCYRVCSAVIMVSPYRSVFSVCCGDSFLRGRSGVAISFQVLNALYLQWDVCIIHPHELFISCN